MPEFIVRAITAETARPVRKAILRSDQPVETTFYPLDDDPETLHVGAFLDGELVGITTCCREAPPGETNPDAWRMRGVAVSEAARGKGCGRAMLQACLDYAFERGGQYLWANGRTTALDFYRSAGFQPRGEEFITDTGPHYLVWRSIP